MNNYLLQKKFFKKVLTFNNKRSIIIIEVKERKELKMGEIREEIQKLLCKLLEESGNIIINSKEMCLEDRLDCYQEIVEEIKKINNKVDYIISETENY